MTSAAADFEDLLKQAFAPVDPPERLSERIESTLVSLTSLAQEELEGWELSAMRDPRNWARPAAAAVVGTTAGAALVVVRARRKGAKRRAQATGFGDLLERTLRDVADEARRLIDQGPGK
jgi:hypothetical protein